MKHLKNFKQYESFTDDSLNEGIDILGKLKTFVEKHLANFKGDLTELKTQLEPYKGKSFSQIKGMIQHEASESLKEYYDPSGEEKRYLTAAAKYDKTWKGKLLNICSKLFGYGALTTLITTIAGSYMSMSDKFDKIVTPEMLGHGVILIIISGILFFLTRLVYNITVPKEYISKGTNADYSARGIAMP